ncbi:MAG: hypothetical protein A2Y94_15985 [Caldithrix sp. RBG_13_44_9]|nr:MAG: hypothetical protein A2Y94_15985 [Caldithrix sp. RBG_13_44_9]
MKKLSYLIFLLVVFTVINQEELLAQKPALGNINIKIDDRESTNFPVQQALLYRKVILSYDSTVLVQGGESRRILYSPQFGSGENHVLRIIAGNLSDQNPDFYDILVVLGDTLPDTVSWRGDSYLVFISKDGMLLPQKTDSRNITGQVTFTRDKKGDIQSGVLFMEFDQPQSLSPLIFSHYIMDGRFELAVGDYRDLSLGQSDSDLKEKEKRRQNIYWALIFSVFLLAIFGLR